MNKFILLIVGIGLLLASCGNSRSEDISVDGSSTVYPIMEAMSEEFMFENHYARITVGVSGTGGGFKRFCAGETDISNASREIKESERELCAANGIHFLELPIALDGLTIVVNPQNKWATELTIEELHHIFRPDDFAVSWADVRDGFPDVKIVPYAPGADSGTFDYFTRIVNAAAGVHRSEDVTFSENDNVLVTGVEAGLGSIAYFGFSYYDHNRSALRAVAMVNSVGNAVAPDIASINSGRYNPMSRSLFIYVRTDALKRPEVAAFVIYSLTETYLVEEVGYIQLQQFVYEDALSKVSEWMIE